MAENSLIKKYVPLPEDNRGHAIDDILDDVLEEIPEMDSVDRSGTLWAILLPLLAVVIIVLIPLLFGLGTYRNTDSVLSRDFPFDSIESELLREKAIEISANREELTRKDETIRRFQKQMEDLDATLGMMYTLLEDTRLAREQAYEAEAEAILADERIRLLALGREESEIEMTLARLKASLDSDYQDRLNEFQDQELGIYRNRIDDMKAERTNLEKALEAAVEERKALAKTLETSELDLLAAYSGSEDLREVGSPAVEADLAALEAARQNENFWLDELASQYLGLFTALSLGNAEAALARLDSLERMFSEEKIGELPGYAPRNEADREIIRFVKAYVTAPEGSEVEDLIAASRVLIEQAEEHTKDGLLQEASAEWGKVESLWPLMYNAMEGSRTTRDITMARDIRRYANLAELSLDSGDVDSAALVWRAGLDEIPDPMGSELAAWWDTWINAEKQRNREREDNLTALIVAYEERLAAERAAETDTADTGGNAGPAETVIQFVDNPKTEQELAAAKTRIAELEAELAALREADTAPAGDTAPKPESAARWELYGTITQILGDTLVIEPASGWSPSVGADLRVMRPLGGDRVIHLADGIILEANDTRSVGTLSSGTAGAEVYGAPTVGDLVYTEH